MSDFDGGLPPLSPLGQEPAADLKGKGLPWPVYLAIGLAVVGVLGFLGLRSWQTREKRKVHVAFMEQFAEFEKNDAGKFWRCLFGKDADPRRWSTPEQMTGQLESALMTDPKNFPEKVSTECIPALTSATKKLKDFSPIPPQDYDEALDKYAKALAGLANAFNLWGEGAPKRVESKIQENKIVAAGQAWNNTANPRKPDPDALRFDRFMRCAVPDLDKLKDGQALLEYLASKCVGKKTDPAFLEKLRDKCIPEAQQPPDKPPATFAKVLGKVSPDFDREEQAWGSCFRSMRKVSKKDDLNAVGQAWTVAINASSAVRKIGAEQLKDE